MVGFATMQVAPMSVVGPIEMLVGSALLSAAILLPKRLKKRDF